MLILNIALGIVAGVVLLFMLPFIIGLAVFIVPPALFMFLFRDATGNTIAIFFFVCVFIIYLHAYCERKDDKKKDGVL